MLWLQDLWVLCRCQKSDLRLPWTAMLLLWLLPTSKVRPWIQSVSHSLPLLATMSFLKSKHVTSRATSNDLKHKATRESHALRHALNHTSCHVHIIEINNILILAAPHSIVHHWMQPTKPAGAPLMSSLDIHRNRRHAADCYLCPQSNISNHWHHSEAPIQWLST